MRALSIGACLVALAAYAHGQSLGEVAERTKEQRKGDGTAKALTQDDVDRAARQREAEAPPQGTPRPRPTPSGTPHRTPPPTSGGITVLEPPSEPQTTRSETSDAAALDAKIRRWRALYSKVQTRIETLEREIEKAKEEQQDLRTMTGWRQYHYDRLRNLEAELAKRKQEIDAIMEQARQDGVTSGQLY